MSFVTLLSNAAAAGAGALWSFDTVFASALEGAVPDLRRAIGDSSNTVGRFPTLPPAAYSLVVAFIVGYACALFATAALVMQAAALGVELRSEEDAEEDGPAKAPAAPWYCVKGFACRLRGGPYRRWGAGPLLPLHTAFANPLTGATVILLLFAVGPALAPLPGTAAVALLGLCWAGAPLHITLCAAALASVVRVYAVVGLRILASKAAVATASSTSCWCTYTKVAASYLVVAFDVPRIGGDSSGFMYRQGIPPTVVMILLGLLLSLVLLVLARAWRQLRPAVEA